MSDGILENRVHHLEQVIITLLANNYHIIGGKRWCERSIHILEGKPINSEGKVK
jgi:hypothetical protein